ncbi:hypothetical protein NL352_30400, partial [Klebsiella pneumoniae]|nr:hypothetical protein [Klebsiella pneumoniae]
MPVEYAAIKSATLHLNKYIVAYVNDSRFRINCVSPGGIFDHQPEPFLEAYKSHTMELVCWMLQKSWVQFYSCFLNNQDM